MASCTSKQSLKEKLENIEWLKEQKCAEPNCWNYRKSGIIYCHRCMGESDTRMSNEDIELIKSEETIRKGMVLLSKT